MKTTSTCIKIDYSYNVSIQLSIDFIDSIIYWFYL